MNEILLPHWAIKQSNGQLELGAQLPTRDGRRCGNAHIIEIRLAHWDNKTTLYIVLTDAGSEMTLTAGEVEELFWPSQWVADVENVKAKFLR